MLKVGLQFFANPSRLYISYPQPDGENVLFVKQGSTVNIVWSLEYDDGTVVNNIPVYSFGGNADSSFIVSNYWSTVSVPSSLPVGNSYLAQVCPIINGEIYLDVSANIVFLITSATRYYNFNRVSPPSGQPITVAKGNLVTVQYSAVDGTTSTTISDIPLNVISTQPANSFEFSNSNRTIRVPLDANVGTYQITYAPAAETSPTSVTVINVVDAEAVPEDFYITGRPNTLVLNKGESRSLEFKLKLSDGSIVTPGGYVWTTVNGIACVDTTITISSNIEFGEYSISVSPVYRGATYTDLQLNLNIVIASQDDFTITLYKNSSEQGRIDKTNYLTSVGVLTGILRESASIVSPIITIQMATVPNFNYVLIPKFSRYYYVVDIVSVRTNLWEITLTVDPLMSFKNAILNCRAFIDRNEFEQSQNIVDTRRVVEEGYTITETEIPNALFNDTAMFSLSGFYCTTGGEAT